MSTAEQLTREQWLAQRRNRLGASDVSAILGLNEYSSPYEVWLEKTGQLEPDKDSPAAKLGRRLEASILDEAEEQLGELERDVVVWAEGLPLAATLDGRVIATGQPVQAKTAGLLNKFADLSAWGDEESDQVPEGYLVQTQAEMLCAGAECEPLFALLAGRGIVRYEIPRSDSAIETIGNYCADWWERHVVQGHEPSNAGLTLDVVKRIRREPKKTVELDDGVESLVQQWTELKAQAREADKAAKQAQATIIAALGDAEAGTLPDGRMLTFYEQTRKEHVVKESSFRVLREKKGKK